jgi:hypothetical protein
LSWKLVFFVYETNGVIQERATILTPFQILRRKKRKSASKPIYFYLVKHRVVEVVFDILDGKNTLIFFALAKPSKSPPKGERRVKGKISTTFCPLRKKSYHSYWQWGRNFVLRNFLVVCGCDFPFFLSKCPKGSTRYVTQRQGIAIVPPKRFFLQILLKS